MGGLAAAVATATTPTTTGGNGGDGFVSATHLPYFIGAALLLALLLWARPWRRGFWNRFYTGVGLAGAVSFVLVTLGIAALVTFAIGALLSWLFGLDLVPLGFLCLAVFFFVANIVRWAALTERGRRVRTAIADRGSAPLDWLALTVERLPTGPSVLCFHFQSHARKTVSVSARCEFVYLVTGEAWGHDKWDAGFRFLADREVLVGSEDERGINVAAVSRNPNVVSNWLVQGVQPGYPKYEMYDLHKDPLFNQAALRVEVRTREARRPRVAFLKFEADAENAKLRALAFTSLSSLRPIAVSEWIEAQSAIPTSAVLVRAKTAGPSETSSVEPARRPQPKPQVASVTSTDADEDPRLALLRRGLALYDRIPERDPGGLAAARATAEKRAQPTTNEDISAWEEDVGRALSEEDRTWFMRSTSSGIFETAQTLAKVMGQAPKTDQSDEMRTRMEQRINRLDRLVKRDQKANRPPADPTP